MNTLILRNVIRLVILAVVLSLSSNIHAEDKDAYQKRIEEKIQTLQTKIDELRAEARELDDPTLLKQWADGLNDVKEKAQAQLEQLKNAGADGWENLRGSVNTAMDNAENFYAGMRRDYYHWRAESRLTNFVERKEALEKRAASIDESKVGLVKKNFSTFDNNVVDARKELGDLEGADVDTWKTAQPSVEYALNQIEMAHNHLAHQVKLLESNQKIDHYSKELSVFKKKVTTIPPKTSDDVKRSVTTFEHKLDEAKAKIDDLTYAGREEWEKISKKVDEALRDVEDLYKQARVQVDQS